ncbi:MAG TPA: peptidoglycan recognition protein [Nitriliruptoraceae bacterium]|nr:peptidoglycan recognition protein [Nitriliruptoraceae bacterium]
MTHGDDHAHPSEADEPHGDPGAPTPDEDWLVAAPQPANDVVMVGADWGGSEGVQVQVRSSHEGTWSAWHALEHNPTEGPDGNGDGVLGTATAPVWLGRSDLLQVRTMGADPEDVEIIAVGMSGSLDSTRPEPTVAAGTAKALPAIHDSPAGAPAPAPAPGAGPSPSAASATTVTSAIPDQPTIVSRSGWGADESLRHPETPVLMDEVRFAVVHHTAGGNDYTPAQSDDIVRSIYAYHTQGRGWWDIGYNFLIDKYGQVFEGRFGGVESAIQGSHAGGFNQGAVGVALMGDHDKVPQSSVATAALIDVLAWKFALHGVNPHSTTTEVADSSANFWPVGSEVELDTIIGHGDTKATGCPGAHLHAIVSSGVLADAVAEAMPSGTARVRPPAGAVAVTGDWDGDGVDTPGWFMDGQWGLHAGYEPDSTTRTLAYGQRGDRPVVGDWDGDGLDTVGVVRGNLWILRNTYVRGANDVVMAYGQASDMPVTGDWDGDGVDTLGVVRGNLWILRSEYRRGADDVVMAYGASSDTKLTGDWNGNGTDTLGVRRGSTWILRLVYRSGGDRRYVY